jgi:hypothetical protein
MNRWREFGELVLADRLPIPRRQPTATAEEGVARIAVLR